jgi:hypothetical protein
MDRNWPAKQPKETASGDRYLDFFAKIPAFVVHGHRRDIVRSKGDVLVTTHVDDAAFAGDHLVKALAALQGHGDDMVAHAGFVLTPKIDCQLPRKWNQVFH